MKLNILKLSFLLVFIVSPFLVSAQQIMIRDFYPVETDLTAMTPGTEKYDQNGEKCALIKVETTDDRFVFDVGALGVSDRMRKAGEIWLYVPFGIRKITVSHPVYGIVRNYLLPCPIERGRTYVMKMDHSQASGVTDPRQKQEMVLQVVPADAEVIFNGMPIELDSKGFFRKKMMFGIYDLMVSHPDYHLLRTDIVINDPDVQQVFQLRLKPAFGWLELDDAEDVQLVVDGTERMMFGEDSRVRLKSATHKIRLEKPHHEAYETIVQIQDSTVARISHEFVPTFRTVTLKAEDHAEIWYGETLLGRGSWTGRFDFGTYDFECRLPSRRSQIFLTIDASTPEIVRLPELETVYGFLDVETETEDAAIAVDGKPVGNGEASVRLPIGKHEVSVTKDGFFPHHQTVEIEENAHSSLNMRLDDKCVVRINVEPVPATVTVDGKYYSSGEDIPLSRGRHKVVVSSGSANYNRIAKTITVKEPYQVFTYKLGSQCYNDTGLYAGLSLSTATKDISMGVYLGANFSHGVNAEAAVSFNLVPLESVMVSDDGFGDPYEYHPVLMTTTVKAGYVFRLGNRVMAIPQIGCNVLSLVRDDVTSKNSHSGTSLMADVRFSLALTRNCEFLAIPEYSFLLGGDSVFMEVSKSSPVLRSCASGFRLSLGIGFYF